MNVARLLPTAFSALALLAGSANAQGFFPDLMSLGTQLNSPNLFGERIVKISDPSMLKDVDPGTILAWTACHNRGRFFVTDRDNVLVITTRATTVDCATLDKELAKRFGA